MEKLEVKVELSDEWKSIFADLQNQVAEENRKADEQNKQLRQAIDKIMCLQQVLKHVLADNKQLKEIIIKLEKESVK